MTDELGRIDRVYTDRERVYAGQDRYSLLCNANLFIFQTRQRALIAAIRREKLLPGRNSRILEVGCGAGGVLLELLQLGFSPNQLVGVDLLEWRVTQAQQKLSSVAVSCADAQRLPFKDETFDAVFQYTVFSSVLDEDIKRNMAREMIRTMKPGGLLVWYDYWTNPLNPNTKGVRLSEVRRLFPSFELKMRRATLLPPLVRAIAPISWTLCELLDRVTWLRTHYLVTGRKVL